MNDLQNKRILITGGAGFVGSFITEQLLAAGVAEVVIIDNFVRGRRDNIRESLATGKVTVVEGDICDRDLLDEHFRGIDYCFHMAALRITQCAAEPRAALDTMYVGTFNVLEACVTHKIQRLLLASSASVYGQAEIFPTTERHHPYNNYTLYGAAKMANELMCQSFQQMYGLNYNALRFFNIYGPRMDTHGKYTEVLIRWYDLIRAGKQPLIYGDGKQTMDFVYIEEIARSCLLGVTSEVVNEVYNIASGRETSLEELCFELLKAMKSDLKPQYIPIPDERKKVEVLRRLADTSKAAAGIGFTSQVSLEDGMARLVAWLDELRVSTVAP